VIAVIYCLEILKVPGQNLFVVADRDQSVSGWVKADPANVSVLVCFAAEYSDTFSLKK
jgi:hypothetical protein